MAARTPVIVAVRVLVDWSSGGGGGGGVVGIGGASLVVMSGLMYYCSNGPWTRFFLDLRVEERSGKVWKIEQMD